MDNIDILSCIHDFCDNTSFIHIATVSSDWYSSWGGRSRYTSAITPNTTIDDLSSFFDQGLNPNYFIPEQISYFGMVELLDYSFSMGCGISYLVPIIAARFGHICILEWLYNNDRLGTGDRVLDSAARYNQKDVIKWAISVNLRSSSSACSEACRYGNLDVLKLLVENGFLVNGGFRTPCGLAVQGNHMNILVYLISIGHSNFEPLSLSYASLNGNLDMVKILRSHGFSWKIPSTYFGQEVYVISEAARGGHLEVMKWMVENGCPIGMRAFNEAAGFGDVKILEWLRDKGCQWENRTMVYASSNSNLDAIKWLHSNGCPWDNRAVFSAAYKNNKEILGWLIDNGCPSEFHPNSSEYSLLSKRCKIDILDWIKERKRRL